MHDENQRHHAWQVGVGICALVLSVGFLRAEDYRLQGVGVDSGGSQFSSVYGLSGDGRVAVGTIRIEADYVPYRWTVAGGLELLGPNPLSGRTADGVSADGTTVAGSNWEGAARWLEPTGWEYLGYLPDGPPYTGGYAHAVSAQGSVIVGEKRNKAFRWTEAEGMQPVQALQTGGDGSALDVSSDGTIIVGFSDLGGQNRAFLWTEAGGVVDLGSLNDNQNASGANAVSDDGSVIVGWSFTDLGRVAVRWFEGDIYILGILDSENPDSVATDVSADGSVVVGFSDVGRDERAFIWTADEGMRDLKHYLMLELDFQINDWTLTHAWAISDDGSVIVGEGINPDGQTEGWHARLIPQRAGDLNYDGCVDQQDLGTLLANWGCE